MRTAAETKALVIEYMEAFSRGDTERMREMMDPESTWWVGGTMPLSGTYEREVFLELLAQVGSTCEGPIQLIPKAFTIDGDRVAVETESLARTLNGRDYKNQYHYLIEFRDDKILRVKEYLDTMHANEVLCVP